MCSRNCCFYRIFSVQPSQINRHLIFRKHSNSFKKAVLIFRSLIVSYFIIYLFLSLLWEHFKLFQYTIQCLFFTICFFIFELYLSFIYIHVPQPNELNYEQRGNNELKIKVSEIASYIFLILALPGTTLATLGYWSFLFKVWNTFSNSIISFINYQFIQIAPEHGFELYFFGINPHGFSLLLLLIDFIFFSGISLKPSHFIYPLIHIVIFIIFALLYHVVHQKWIYVILDLKKKMAYFTYPGIIIAPPIIFLLYCALGYLRDYISKKYERRGNEEGSNNTENNFNNEILNEINYISGGRNQSPSLKYGSNQLSPQMGQF